MKPTYKELLSNFIGRMTNEEFAEWEAIDPEAPDNDPAYEELYTRMRDRITNNWMPKI